LILIEKKKTYLHQLKITSVNLN